MNCYNYFSSSLKNPLEFETDENKKFENIHKCIEKKLCGIIAFDAS
mgnify:CR=1 FL=1